MQLKIGGHFYTIIRADLPGQQCGETDKCAQVITIDENLKGSVAESTLFHEVMHVENSELAHDLLDSLAEQTYQWLSDNGLLNHEQLYRVLRENGMLASPTELPWHLQSLDR